MPPFSSTSEMACLILFRSEAEILRGTRATRNRLYWRHLVYKMHLSVVVNTGSLKYQSFSVQCENYTK